MLKIMGAILKTTLFALLVLVLGNYVRWHGTTINDQVKTQLAHAERMTNASEVGEKVRDWAGKLTDDAREGLQKKWSPHEHQQQRRARRRTESEAMPQQAPAKMTAQAASDETAPSEEIGSSERQKLRALIQELNSAHN